MPADNRYNFEMHQLVHQQLRAIGADTLGIVTCASDTSFKCVMRPCECLHDYACHPGQGIGYH